MTRGGGGEFPRPVLSFKLSAGWPLHTSPFHGGAGSQDHRPDQKLPYVSEVFPLGSGAGQKAEVEVKGFNLGDTRQVPIEARSSGESLPSLSHEK